ncbi:MAG: PAS domain S-box protein, partial [Candidatus Omnitrophica bacterium]|nr:PAS domain S-box protein [Candidatus Omnitrophota bacterium]
MNAKESKSSEGNPIYWESEKMYRRLIESVKSGVYMTDVKGRLFYVNEAFVRMLGFESKDNVIGLNLMQELFAKTEEKTAFIDQMKRTGFVKDFEFTSHRQDQSVIILSATSNHIRNEREEIIGFEGIVTDVTEKKNLEYELRLEKNKLEDILDFDEKISKIRDFDQLIDFIVHKTAHILEADKCSLMLEDGDKKELKIIGAVGLPQEMLESYRIPFGESIAGIVAQEQKPLLVRNIEYEKRFKRANRATYKSRSFMSVPIKLDKKLMGVMNVADKHPHLMQEVAFNETDLRIHCAIAREVAVA